MTAKSSKSNIDKPEETNQPVSESARVNADILALKGWKHCFWDKDCSTAISKYTEALRLGKKAPRMRSTYS